MIAINAPRRLFAALLSALALALVPLTAAAQGFTLPPPEKVPTFLGIDLPLRPGERLAPIGKGDCSAVVFAPLESRYQKHAKFWSGVEWLGPCRFGLAHGNGALSLSDGRVIDKPMLYGLEGYPPREVFTRPFVYRDGTSGEATTQELSFFRTDIFSSLNTSRLWVTGYDFIPNVKTLTEVELLWFWKSNLQIYSFDASGQERLMTVYELNPPCSGDVPKALKAFASEIGKVCRREPDRQRILVQAEGTSDVPVSQHVTTDLAACPIDNASGFIQCDRVLREVLGKKLVAEVEAIMASDAASRLAASKEVLARYAPIEAAVTQRMAELAARQKAEGAAP